MRYSDTQKGRSMIEVIGYMGVFMVLIAGVGRLVASAFEDYKYSRASLQLGDLAAAVTRAAAVDGNYADVVKEDKWKRYVPDTFRKKNNKYYHAFGGEMSMSCASDSESCAKFTITFSGLNKKQCVELAMKDWSKNKTVSLDKMQTDNTNVWCWHNCSKKFPVQRHQVEGVDGTSNAACGKDSTGEQKNKQIIWTFN